MKFRDYLVSTRGYVVTNTEAPLKKKSRFDDSECFASTIVVDARILGGYPLNI